MYFVYIVECNDSTYYCGYTNNLEKRITTHNNKKGAKYTKSRTPVKLIYFEQVQTISEALKREVQIKKLSKKKKQQLTLEFIKLNQSTDA